MSTAEQSTTPTTVPVGSQGVLFDTGNPAERGDRYRGPAACKAAGITYRQLDYWARTGLVEPSVRSATGSGSQRLYGFRDILVLKVVKRLLDTGVSLQQIRLAITSLRQAGVEELSRITLMSDGATVYECTSPDEIVDLLAGGQGVFGIALGRVWREVEGELAELPSERPDDETPAHPGDELSARLPAWPDPTACVGWAPAWWRCERRCCAVTYLHQGDVRGLSHPDSTHGVG